VLLVAWVLVIALSKRAEVDCRLGEARVQLKYAAVARTFALAYARDVFGIRTRTNAGFAYAPPEVLLVAWVLVIALSKRAEVDCCLGEARVQLKYAAVARTFALAKLCVCMRVGCVAPSMVQCGVGVERGRERALTFGSPCTMVFFAFGYFAPLPSPRRSSSLCISPSVLWLTPRHPLVLGGSSNQLQKNLGGRNCPRNRRARAQRFETEKASSHGMSAAQTPTEATEAAGPTFPTILHVNLALRAS
jgi:hypothetical protein